MVLRLKCSSPCHLSFGIAYVGVWMFRFYKTILNLKTRLQKQNLKKILIFFHYHLNLLICCKTKLKIKFIFYRVSLFYRMNFFTEWNFSQQNYIFLKGIQIFILNKKLFFYWEKNTYFILKNIIIFWIVLLHLNNHTQGRCFLVNFAKYLRTPYFQNTSGTNIFSNKIGKAHWEKEKRLETASKKNNDKLRKKNLNTIYFKSSHPFTIQKFFYYSFPCFPIIHWKHVFSESMQFLWYYVYT